MDKDYLIVPFKEMVVGSIPTERTVKKQVFAIQPNKLYVNINLS